MRKILIPQEQILRMLIGRGTMDRLGIFASLKVPEVWTWDGETLGVNVLTARRTYRTSKRSKAFPFLPLDAFREFLSRTDLGETKLIRSFRAWVRENSTAWK